jgi:hypothetical protein
MKNAVDGAYCDEKTLPGMRDAGQAVGFRSGAAMSGNYGFFSV